VHTQDRARPRLDRRPIVTHMRPVGRTHLDQPRPGGTHDVRDPERPADLDQFTPADRDPTLASQGGQGQHEGGRAVVHRERRLGTRQPGQGVPDGRVPPTPLAGVQVHLEIDGAGRSGECRDGIGRQRGTAQVGVEQDPGGVDDRCEPANRPRGDAVECGGHQVVDSDLAPRRRRSPCYLEGRAQRSDHRLATVLDDRLGDLRSVQETPEGRDGTTRIAHDSSTRMLPGGPSCVLPTTAAS
jgi:hypothetical protein